MLCGLLYRDNRTDKRVVEIVAVKYKKERGLCALSFCCLETIFRQDIDAVGVRLCSVHIFATAVEIFGCQDKAWRQVPEYISEDVLSLLVHIVTI